MSDAHRLALVEGTADGVYAWLDAHPVAVGEPMVDAVGEAMTRWLDADREEIVDQITRLHRRLARSHVLEEEVADLHVGRSVPSGSASRQGETR